MAMEAAAVFPKDYPFPHPFRLDFVDPGSLDPGFGSFPLDSPLEGEWSGHSSVSVSALSLPSPAEDAGVERGEVQRVAEAAAPSSSSSTKAAGRPKRRRPKSRKSREDIENQRMTHIAVERNRRKQMNEYLSSLRSLMPESYCPRSDQASIVGSAINFVKELEYKIRLLEARRDLPITNTDDDGPTEHLLTVDNVSLPPAQNKQHFPETAEVEVSMVESHASLKIRSRPRPKQLLKLILGLQALRLTVLHLDILTIGELIHYSISLKAEDHCKLTSGEEISSAVHRILLQIQE